MKKLFLLLLTGSLIQGVTAQVKSVVMTGVESQHQKSLVDKKFENAWQRLQEARQKDGGSVNRTTAAGQRLYNWVEYGSLAIGTPSDYLPYMWYNPDMYAIYSATGGGVELDTINLVSYGMVLQPWGPWFNDPSFAGEIAIERFHSYKADSIVVWGTYGRNPAKTSIVDTLIVSLAYANPSAANSSIDAFRYTGADIKARFGHDTILVGSIYYDTATHTADGNTVVTKYIPLTAAMAVNDTDAVTGLNRFAIPFGTSIPAGNLVGATVTFKTGESYTPFSDTVFVGSVDPDTPFKYNMLRPWFFEQTNGQYPKYFPDNLNAGVFKILPRAPGTGYEDSYVPGFAYIDADARLEFPYIDFVLSCADCWTVGVANVKNIVNDAVAYPNPANTTIKIAYRLNTATESTVSLTNTLGQVVRTQKMNATTRGEAEFNTSDLVNGVYFYTVEADGQRITNKITVAH